MNKILLGVCVALVIACCFMWFSLDSTKKDLVAAQVDLEIARSTIVIKEREIQATNDALTKHLNEVEDLRNKRAADAKTIKSLLEKPDNAEWGNSKVPEDIRNFLLDSGVTREGVKK